MPSYDGSVVIGAEVDTGPAEKSVQRLADTLKSSITAAAKAAAAAIGAATAAIGVFAKSSVETGMQFDGATSQVAATMGKSVNEIGDLRDFAMEMGANTVFSATQAADALNYMALAGYDAEESMEALPNVLNLAAAGGIGLAVASDMVTDAQSALGLSMEQSAALVDQMAMASSKSNTSVAQLGDAILTIGGTAKNLAGGTTELSTALGILADNGIKGAEGGTALRNIILSLSAPTDTAAKAMKSLGVEVFDAQGNMRPLNETFSDLNAALSSMTQGEQTQALSKIFNKEDLKSVNALLGTNADRWNELAGCIDSAAGAAEQMAGTQLDNLSGDITLFKSALEGAQIILSDQLSPSLREFVEFGSEGISKIASAFQEGGLSGAMEAFGAVLSDGLNMIIEQLPAMVDAGMKLLGALGQGIIDNLPTIIDVAVEIVTSLISGLIEAFPQIISAAVEIVTTLSSGISESLPELIPAAIEAILQIVEALIDNVDQLIDAAIEIILALADGLIEALPKLIEKAPVIIGKLATAIAENLPKIVKAGMDLIVRFAAGIIENIPEAVKSIPKIISALVDGFTKYMSNIKDVGKNIVRGLWDGILAMGAWIKEKVSGFFGGIVDSVKGLLGIHSPSTVFAGIGENISRGLANGIQAEAGLVASTMNGVAQRLSSTKIGSPAWAAALPSISPQQVPRIAQGSVIPASPQFTSSISRAESDGSVGEQLSAIMQMLQNSAGNQQINITVESVLDGKVVARNTVHHINDMTRQSGKPVLLI